MEPPNSSLKARHTRLRAKMRELELDAFIIFSPANRRYLSGFTGSFGYVLLTLTDEKVIFTDWRYTEQIAAQAPHFEVVELFKNKHLWSPLKVQLERLGVNRLGFEGAHVPYRWWESARREVPVTWVATDGLVEGLRTIKDEYEVGRLKQAQAVADEVFSAILPRVKPGVSERELAVELRYLVEQSGAENYPGLPIVASGPRAALPHGVASEKKVQQGEFVLFDFGAIVDGYLSDMTRTVVCGKADAKQLEVYQLVRQAEEAGVALMREGVTGQTVDRACRRPLHNGGYGDYTHGYSVGHGLGLEVHETPFMSEGYLAPLEAGMVITVEPGIYIPSWGGVRIEDTVLVTQRGCEVFDTSSRDLLEL